MMVQRKSGGGGRAGRQGLRWLAGWLASGWRALMHARTHACMPSTQRRCTDERGCTVYRLGRGSSMLCLRDHVRWLAARLAKAWPSLLLCRTRLLLDFGLAAGSRKQEGTEPRAPNPCQAGADPADPASCTRWRCSVAPCSHPPDAATPGHAATPTPPSLAAEDPSSTSYERELSENPRPSSVASTTADERWALGAGALRLLGGGSRAQPCHPAEPAYRSVQHVQSALCVREVASAGLRADLCACVPCRAVRSPRRSRCASRGSGVCLALIRGKPIQCGAVVSLRSMQRAASSAKSRRLPMASAGSWQR